MVNTESKSQIHPSILRVILKYIYITLIYKSYLFFQKTLFFSVSYAVLFITIIFFSNNLYSQSLIWNKIIDFEHGVDRCYSMCNNDKDEIFVTGGAGLNYPSGIQIPALKFNKYGDTLWARFIGDSLIQYGFGIDKTMNGGCVITGEWLGSGYSYILNLDSTGNVVWLKYFYGNAVQFWDIKSTLDGGYISCGNIDYNKGYILKVDSLGNKQWDKIVTITGLYVTFKSVTLANDVGYVISGSKSNIIDGWGFIMKLNNSGDSLWSQSFKIFNAPTSIFEIENINNGYIVTGIGTNSAGQHDLTYFTKINSNGEIYFTKVFDDDLDHWNPRIKIINNNKYVTGTTADDMQTQTFIVKVYITDSSGNICNQRIFRLDNDDIILHSIAVQQNNFIILAGEVDYYNSIYQKDIFVSSIDSNLNGPPIGIQLNNNKTENNNILKVYPNPFNSEIDISLNLNKIIDDLTIDVFDIQGRIIDEFLVKDKLFNKNSFRWKNNNIASGIYFIILKDKFIILDKKKIIFIK